MLAKVYHLSYYSKIHLFQLVYYYKNIRLKRFPLECTSHYQYNRPHYHLP